MGRPLKIAKAQAVITITDTAAATDIVTTSANLTQLGIIKGMPFVTASNVGGLTAGTTYWILDVLSATTFTVSATDLSANPTFTKVDLSATSGQTVATSVGVVDSYFNNPAGSSNTYSVVGGNTAIYGNQVLANVCIGVAGAGTITVSTTSPNIVGVGTDLVNTFTNGTIVYNNSNVILGTITDIANANATFATLSANSTSNVSAGAYLYGLPETGFVVRQKGKQKYLVKGTITGLSAQCLTANVANTALLPNTMTITATYANTSTVKVQSVSDHTAELFTANSGPVASGNIILADANPAFVTFNTAEAANVSNAMPYPLVQIGSA